MLPLGWNIQDKSADYKFCDVDNCLLPSSVYLSNRIVLTCGHSFHQKCLHTLFNDKCNYCFDYFSSEIERNIKSLNKRLFTPLKENEIPLFEDENDDLNVDNNDDSKSIESILEKTEYDIENQYSIMYVQCQL